MPAKSRAQQKFMGLCASNPEKAMKPCPPKAVAREIARQPTKGLPERAKKR